MGSRGKKTSARNGPRPTDRSSGSRETGPSSRLPAWKRAFARGRQWLRDLLPSTRREGGGRQPPETRRLEDGPTTFDVLEEKYFPEGRGAPRRIRIRAWAISTAAAVLVASGGFAGTYVYDLWSTRARLGEERRAQAEIDREGPAFTASIAYDTSLPEGFKVVLDRPLTTEEVEELSTVDNAEAWNFLEGLGGRMIPDAGPGHTITPPSGWSWQDERTPRIGSAVFTMTLLSERRSQLSIVDMAPTNISCTDPTATTVVEFPSAGEATYPGVIVEVTHDDPALLVLDEGLDQGQPYFGHRRIDLGGGLEPGGLRVQAMTSGLNCEWEIRAEYVDAKNNSGEVVLRNDDAPFFVEAPPPRPEQYWILPPGTEPHTVACHEENDDPGCPDIR